MKWGYVASILASLFLAGGIKGLIEDAPLWFILLMFVAAGIEIFRALEYIAEESNHNQKGE